MYLSTSKLQCTEKNAFSNRMWKLGCIKLENAAVIQYFQQTTNRRKGNFSTNHQRECLEQKSASSYGDGG